VEEKGKFWGTVCSAGLLTSLGVEKSEDVNMGGISLSSA